MNTMRNVKVDPMNYISFEFREHVMSLSQMGWEQDVYPSEIEHDGEKIPVYQYIVGRNASHQFAMAESRDGKRWFKVITGEDTIPVAQWEPCDHEHYNMLKRVAATAKPVMVSTDLDEPDFSMVDEEVADGEVYSPGLAKFALGEYSYNEAGEVTGMWGMVTRVSECSSFEEAVGGYMGHW
jgi:hypothetical protein